MCFYMLPRCPNHSTILQALLLVTPSVPTDTATHSTRAQPTLFMLRRPHRLTHNLLALRLLLGLMVFRLDRAERELIKLFNNSITRLKPRARVKIFIVRYTREMTRSRRDIMIMNTSVITCVGIILEIEMVNIVLSEFEKLLWGGE